MKVWRTSAPASLDYSWKDDDVDRTECNKDDITGVPPVYGVVVRGVARLLLYKLLDRVYHSLQRLNPRRQLQIFYLVYMSYSTDFVRTI